MHTGCVFVKLYEFRGHAPVNLGSMTSTRLRDNLVLLRQRRDQSEWRRPYLKLLLEELRYASPDFTCDKLISL